MNEHLAAATAIRAEHSPPRPGLAPVAQFFPLPDAHGPRASCPRRACWLMSWAACPVPGSSLSKEITLIRG